MRSSIEKDIEYWKRKSQETFEAATFLYRSGFYADCVSRVYYAAIYIIKALFIKDGIYAYKPNTMLVTLGREYVIPGKLGASYHRNLMQIFDKRFHADFDPHAMIDSDTASELIGYVKEIQEEISKIIEKNYFDENVS